MKNEPALTLVWPDSGGLLHRRLWLGFATGTSPLSRSFAPGSSRNSKDNLPSLSPTLSGRTLQPAALPGAAGAKEQRTGPGRAVGWLEDAGDAWAILEHQRSRRRGGRSAFPWQAHHDDSAARRTWSRKERPSISPVRKCWFWNS